MLYTELELNYRLNQYLTVLISVIIAVTYLIGCQIINLKKYKSNFIKVSVKTIIFSFSFISILYLLQIFDLPRLYVLAICVLFLPSLIFLNFLSAGYLYEIDVNLENYSISNINAYRVGNRIRDIEYIENLDSYFLLLENPPEIALLSKQN